MASGIIYPSMKLHDDCVYSDGLFWILLFLCIFFIISVQKVVLFKELDFKKSSSMGGTIIKQNEEFPIGKMACFLTLK